MAPPPPTTEAATPFMGYDPLSAGPFKNLYTDLLGTTGGDPASTGPQTAKAPATMEQYMRGEEGMVFFPIDDPNYYGTWGNTDLSMKLPELDMTDKPITCEDVCIAKAKLRRENCKLLRRRVAEALKKQGCPSKVLPLPEARKCFGSKKPAPKKTTVTKKSTKTKR